MTAFAGLALESTSGRAVDTGRLRDLVRLAAESGELAHTLQSERTAAVQLLSPGAGPAERQAYRDKCALSDQAAARYRAQRGAGRHAPETARRLLQGLDAALQGLPLLRKQVHEDPQATLSATVFRYRIPIADALDYRDGIARAPGVDARLSDRLRASAALTRSVEFNAQQQIAVLRALTGDSLTPAARQEISASGSGSAESASVFTALAPADWKFWLDRSQTGMWILDAQRSTDAVTRTGVGQRLPVEGPRWAASTTARMETVYAVALRVDRAVLADVTAVRDNQRAWAYGEGALTLVALGGAVGLALWLARPTVRGLRGLRDAAHGMAYEGLPQAVAELREPGALGGEGPEEFAARAAAPVRVEGKDEIAAVGRAFNEVYASALRGAAEQAAQRDGVAAVLIGLARRNQRLTDGLTSVLDEAERSEADPDRLARLYRLDHLVQRMGRTNDSLLVLGGAGSARVRDESSLLDVVRAAAGRIERFPRVDLGVVDVQLTVDGRARDDVVHLLAEILDNATSFSPPGSRVTVDGRWLADRTVVQVTDVGIGIDDERRTLFNERLRGGGSLDQLAVRDAVRAMGLTVVGRISARHGITVELRRNPGGGIIAEVTLPVDIARAEVGTGRHRAGPPDGGTQVSGALFAGRARFTGGDGDSAPAATEEPVEPVGSVVSDSPTVPAQPVQTPAPEVKRSPQESEPAGVTESGLPKRVRQTPDTTSGAGPEKAIMPSVPAPRSAPEAGPAKTAGPQRDPRRTAAAMSAFAQGIGHSRSRAVPQPAPAQPPAPVQKSGAEEHTRAERHDQAFPIDGAVRSVPRTSLPQRPAEDEPQEQR